MVKSNADHVEFQEGDVELIEKDVPFKGYFSVEKYTLRHKTPEGDWTKPITREIFERGHACAMLPYDPVKDIVVLIEQFRPGAYAAGYCPWLLEVPAGIIEEGQTPQDVARRETQEETGCTAKRLEFIADYLVSPGGSTETMQLYCVEVDADEAFEVGGLEEEGEHIAVMKMSSAEALARLENGQIHNSMSMIAVQWLKIHMDDLRKKWCA